MRDKGNGELHSCKLTNRWLENPQVMFMGYFARKDREKTLIICGDWLFYRSAGYRDFPLVIGQVLWLPEVMHQDV